MSQVKNVLLVGVGGQGTILASKILSSALLKEGYDVKMSEVHGMAQRGGSVTTQIRFGNEVFSPIIEKGEADIIVSFEKMEALRWIDYLKPDGMVVINDYEIPSAPIIIGKAEYPSGIFEELKKVANITVIEAAKIAKNLGNIKAMNVVLLGALVKAMQLDDFNWEEALKNNVKPQFFDMNLKAFNEGISQIK